MRLLADSSSSSSISRGSISSKVLVASSCRRLRLNSAMPASSSSSGTSSIHSPGLSSAARHKPSRHVVVKRQECLRHRLGLCLVLEARSLAVPNPWKPLIRLDRGRVEVEAREEAIGLAQQHRLVRDGFTAKKLVKHEKLVRKIHADLHLLPLSARSGVVTHSKCGGTNRPRQPRSHATCGSVRRAAVNRRPQAFIEKFDDRARREDRDGAALEEGPLAVAREAPVELPAVPDQHSLILKREQRAVRKVFRRRLEGDLLPVAGDAMRMEPSVDGLREQPSRLRISMDLSPIPGELLVVPVPALGTRT